MGRKVIIGVMGGNESIGALAAEAADVGAAITRSESILLTGGFCIESPDIKHAAMLGAQKESLLQPGKIARLIGILPEKCRRWDDRIPHTLFLSTNLGSVERDPITGTTPDVLVFFAGSCGTLCELAFALQANRKVLFWKAVRRLLEKYDEHTERDTELDQVLRSALDACKSKLSSVHGITADTTVATLKERLKASLESERNFVGDFDQLIQAAIALAADPSPKSGFPGFRDDPTSKERFEQIVLRISE